MDENLDHETPLSELFDDQVACADMIVINKTDLLSEDEATGLVSTLRSESRDAVQVVKTSMGKLPVDVLLGQGVGAEADLEARHEVHHHHHHDDHEHADHDNDQDHHHEHEHGHDEFESFHVTLPEVTDGPAFAERLARVIEAHGILRLKGFVAVEGKPMRMVVQAVGPRIDTYFDRPFGREARETRLVVIGLHGMDAVAIRAALEA
jgi:cobalamin biosynthesis protein CobW